jgi:hypothetical protein
MTNVYEFDVEEPLDESPPTEEEPSHIVDVRVVNPEQEAAPDFGEATTWTFLGTTADVPVQILPESLKRHRAVIQAYGVSATILVGAFAKVSNGQGFSLRTGAGGTSPSLVIESASAVWAMSDKTVASTITVWDERYR